MGAGLRVPLKVHALRGFQFFPGQIVALKGINASGDEFTVSEVLEMPLLPSAASAPSTLVGHLDRLKGGPDAMETDSLLPLSLMFASGPYTADNNLDFEPLHELCSQAADSYADTLVLGGPFIDVDHPLIATGDFELPEEVDTTESESATMTTVFKHMISPALTRLTSANPSITILLVPSVKDVISKHVSWPQEPFPRKDLGLPKSVRIIGNPMTLSLNEISLGICSQDILSELKVAEVVAGSTKDSGVLSRLPRYLIEQRNFFPLFPPLDRERLSKTRAADGKPVGSMLDVSYLKLGDMINVKPDLLVVPSALPPFAKVSLHYQLKTGSCLGCILANITQIVESVLVLNPGFLSRRRGPGTFAKVTVLPRMLEEEEQGAAMVAHKLYERARVDIVRI
jgi:DNA polymerase alpha subunit B